MYLRGAQLDSVSFFVTPHLAEAKRNLPTAGYMEKHVEEFVGQTAYNYDDDNDDDYGGGDYYDDDIVCLQSAAKRYFSYI
jgi:hypothetical protein